MIPRSWAPRLMVLCLGIIAYAPALPTGFLYDDHLLIESNSTIRSWSFANLHRDFSSGVFQSTDNVNFYRPLQILSTRVEYSLVRLRPLLYHLTNLLLHLGNALLFYELILVLGFPALSALLAGCLFAVHPIIVEPMLMVSGRGEQLGFFFTLACILFYLRQSLACVFLSLGSYVLALFSKESSLITPALLALVLYYKKEKASRYGVLIPLAVISGLFLLLRHQAVGNALPAWDTLRVAPFFYQAFPVVLLRYGRILLVPWDLHTDRLLPLIGPLWIFSTCAVAALAGWVFSKGPRWAVLCFGWYVLAFLPKSVLMISGSFMSDHWAYPALPALAIPLALGLERGWTSTRKAARVGARLLFAVMILMEIACVHYNVATRNTDEKLYRSALRYDNSPTMRRNLAMLLLRQGHARQAIYYLKPMVAVSPNDVFLQHALALSYWKDGQAQKAYEVLKTRLHLVPDDITTHQMLDSLKAPR